MHSPESKRILLFIPILLFLHNVEEAITMPQWMNANLPILQQKIPLFQFLEFSVSQLYVSLTLVTIIPILISFFCLRGELTPRKTAVMQTLQSIIFWNALMPHLSGIMLLGFYNPGAITAIVCTIPFSIYLYHKTISSNEEIFRQIPFRKIVITGGIIYLPLVSINHLIATTISLLF
ncbi:MAG: HXXEE domain-containing protein [Bacteriovoracaceae bacterium]|nr:HXXEE domain-containing protein [Bacteroidota bacterium]